MALIVQFRAPVTIIVLRRDILWASDPFGKALTCLSSTVLIEDDV